jgi:uncharacterized repeat protein (TIGR03803 family)
VAPGNTYDVTEFSEPVGQDCSVTGGSGGASADITGVLVTCVTVEQVLYSFGLAAGDGTLPYAALMIDSAGNLYGTTMNGGSQNCVGGCGTVFKLGPNGSGYTESVLHGFTASGDGADPVSALVMDNAGNLYGTTWVGAYSGFGTVFKLAPNGGGGYTESVMYSFLSGADGANPNSALIMDSSGNLYGTTGYGGGYSVGDGNGTVFRLAPNGSGGYTESVLYSFSGGTVAGTPPTAGLVMDSAGSLYGTTSGIVFKLTPTSGGYTESILYSFAGGDSPFGGVVLDSTGDIYGTTMNGGSFQNCVSGCGTVFKLVPNGSGGYTESVMHSFAGGNIDGANPHGTLIIDSAGKLYGTTVNGGAGINFGTVFEVFPH